MLAARAATHRLARFVALKAATALALAVLAYAPAACRAQGALPPAPIEGAVRLELPRRAISLAPVGLADFAAGADAAKALRAVDLQATPAGAGLVARAPMTLPLVETRIERKIDGLYRLEGDLAKSGQRRTVRVMAESLAGEPGYFTCREDPAARIPVLVRELPPRTVGKGERAAREGAVTLEFPLAELRRTGVYSGRLVVQVESY